MASVKFITERIEGKKKELEKLNKKLGRIIEAKESNWERNPYYYNERDLKHTENDIENCKKALAKYEAQLEDEKQKESDLPKLFEEFRTNLVANWDESDKKERARLRKIYEEMKNADTSRNQMESYGAFIKEFKYSGYEFMRITDEEIHRNNMRDGERLIKNLWTRVKDITGDVTENYLRLERGNEWEGLVITGFIVGVNGKAEVETILAGGYNIQRLHIRTLVHKR